eukprot:1158231-Pelagomonas_calceolata.AAC.2
MQIQPLRRLNVVAGNSPMARKCKLRKPHTCTQFELFVRTVANGRHSALAGHAFALNSKCPRKIWSVNTMACITRRQPASKQSQYVVAWQTSTQKT